MAAGPESHKRCVTAVLARNDSGNNAQAGESEVDFLQRRMLNPAHETTGAIANVAAPRNSSQHQH